MTKSFVCGNLTVSVSAGATVTQQVVYDTAFSNAPKVFIQPLAWINPALEWIVLNSATTDFNFRVTNNASSALSITVNWLAVDI